MSPEAAKALAALLSGWREAEDYEAKAEPLRGGKRALVRVTWSENTAPGTWFNRLVRSARGFSSYEVQSVDSLEVVFV